jgi:hypothetical protein
MEHQPPTASAWLNRKPTAPEDAESDAEIARLKERLSFYETFDSLIQENVSRAGELLRHAAATRENAEHQRAESRREMEQLRNDDRHEYRSLLSGLLDDVTTMQVQIERLARRVADALDDLEVTLPAGGNGGYLSATTSTPPAMESAPPLPIEPTMDELLPPDPPGEAEHGIPVTPPAEEVEAAAIAAEIETTEAAPASTDHAALLEALFDADGIEPAAASPEHPDTTLVMDEVVQEPESTESAVEPESGADSEDESIGDGVLSDEPFAATEPDPAPAAPAEENTVEPAASSTATAVAAKPETPEAEEEPAPPKLPWISSDIRPFSVDGGAGVGIRRPVTGDLRTPESAQRTSGATSTLVAPDGFATAVLVHGVPRATTALSLKRYLEGLPHVLTVEPREYAEGILRLHVTGQRTLKLDDLRGWSDGAEIQPVYIRDDLIEVRLPD